MSASAISETANTQGGTALAVDDARPEDEREDMPLPRDPRTIFLGGLFFFACVTCLYVAKDVILPIMLATVLKLLLQPLVETLERIRVPRALGALMALVVLLIAFGMIVSLLTGPATAWATHLPEAWPKLQERFSFLKEPIAAVQRVMRDIGMGASHAEGKDGGLLSLNSGALVSAVFSGTGEVASKLLETLLILFYLLVFGETFLRRIVEILPRFSDKRQAVEISQHIERDLSAYMVTITVINAVVGMATAGVMWLCDIGDPVLWGVIAFCLNFVPILGPFTGVLVFGVVGLMSMGATWLALLPSALYFGIHVLEGEIVTPMLLARRFTVNPVAVMLALVFWYWLWGVVGAILAVPIMAIVKIVCDRLRPLRALGHFLEG